MEVDGRAEDHDLEHDERSGQGDQKRYQHMNLTNGISDSDTTKIVLEAPAVEPGPLARRS
jgi:hypothetical protein